MEGAEDIWASGEITWFDWTIGVWGLIATALLLLALFGPDAWHRDLRWGLGLVGAILLFNAAFLGVIRTLAVRGVRQERRSLSDREAGSR